MEVRYIDMRTSWQLSLLQHQPRCYAVVLVGAVMRSLFGEARLAIGGTVEAALVAAREVEVGREP